jgi:hypothetical protein
MAVLLVIFGVLGLLLSVVIFAALRDDAAGGVIVPAPGYMLAGITVVVALAQVVSGVFLFRGREWARLLAITVCAINLISGVISLASGAVTQAVLGVVVNIAFIAGLNHYEVKIWCRR